MAATDEEPDARMGGASAGALFNLAPARAGVRVPLGDGAALASGARCSAERPELVSRFQALKVGADVGGVLIAEVAIFLEALADDFFESGREIGIEAKRRDGSSIEDFFEDDAGGFAVEGKLAGGHFVEDDGEGEEIGASVEIFGADLFGGHVGYGADGGAGAGEMLRVGDGRDSIAILGWLGAGVGVGLFGEAEVEDFGVAAAGDEDVGRFYVAMDDAGGVSGVESVGDLNRDVEKLIEIDGAIGDEVFEGLAVEEFHGDEGAAFVFADVVDGADVWVVQSGGGLGFALEAGEGLRVGGDIFGEEFEGDETAEAGVFGFVDDAHAAAADFFGDGVVGEVLADQGWVTPRANGR